MKLSARTIQMFLVAVCVGLSSVLLITTTAQDSGKVYELRIYTATPGNLENLHTRFRDHTLRIFEKHGMQVVGFWSSTAEEDRDNQLIYVLEHASRAAADAAWSAFGADPEWRSVSDASNANGPILGNVERHYMVATDYSPLQ